MNRHEKEIYEMIHNSPDPLRATKVVTEAILQFLAQNVHTEQLRPEDPRG